LINRIACGKAILIHKNIMKRSACVRKASQKIFFLPDKTGSQKDNLEFVIGSYVIATEQPFYSHSKACMLL
jgi:hypothetical protein